MEKKPTKSDKPKKSKVKTTTPSKSGSVKKKAVKPKKPVKKKAKVEETDKKAKKIDEDEIEIVEEELEEEEEVEVDVHVAKLKPKLDKDIVSKLRLRKRRKKNKPKFRRQEWFRYKRLGKSWRKPRGLHSKMRINKKYRPNVVRIGYGSPKNVKGLHPSGFKEIMVWNVKDLQDINPKTEAVRIGHSVGTKKRIALEQKADELGIRVLNKGA
jgi:large subunit ribosomal protein L32e